MNDIPDGVLAYFAISALVSLFMHWRLRRFFTSCLACFFLGPMAFGIACILRGEAMGLPPIAIALFFATLSFLIAAAIGLPFWLLRRKSQQSSREGATG
jgi:hypothetical protein